MTKWTVSKDEVEVRNNHDFVTVGIDFDIEGEDVHWSKAEVHDIDADEALRLAEIVAAALNERENILNG